MRADPSAQLRLLDVQTADSALARLRHRSNTLPEHAELARLGSERAALGAELVRAETQVSDLEKDNRKAERDLEPVRERRRRNESRIADGTVSDPKALNGLIEEVAHLGRRISELEDTELELMEALEEAGQRREALSVEVAGLDDRARALTGSRDEKAAALDQEARGIATQRAALAIDVPADLLALYTKLQPGHGGVGAAELRARRCTGCQLEVNAADLREIAAAPVDEVLRCEECGRILVRTQNSGL